MSEMLRGERECPRCAELILARARICKHCGRELEPLEWPTNPAVRVNDQRLCNIAILSG